MIRNVLLIAAMLAIAEGSVLVRFINTVPTRIARDSATSTTDAYLSAYSGTDPRIDRVGLQYFSDVIATPTIVWTQPINANDGTGITDVSVTPAPAAPNTGAVAAPYSGLFSMPPLRAYHTRASPEVVAADRPYGVIADADNVAAVGGGVTVGDNYDQSRLFADGVGLYLNFAAGTYRMQAYGTISDASNSDVAAATTVRNAATARGFTDSSVSFTFVDNKVYTIIAYGGGQFGATTPLQGNTVRLTMIEESIAPTTFGMGAIRFFNAFGTSGSSIDVFQGTTASDATRIASGIAVGTVSAYIDVNPGTTKDFPVAVAGSTTNYLASGTNTQRDVRAGSRQTVICGINNEAGNVGFCRGLPSRVVAYVRLVADTASQNAVVQGKVGAQRLSITNLNLWASYEFPRPEQVEEQSQVVGNAMMTGHPVTSDGLYPVVVNVAPGKISGYGEVFVPIYIMDRATRWTITARATDNLDFTAGGLTGYAFAPKWKRVNFVLKTDGMATLTGKPDGNNDNYIFPFVGANQEGKPTAANDNTGFTKRNTGHHDLRSSISLNKPLEVGEYYTIFATAQQAATTTTPIAYQAGSIIKLFIRRDRSLSAISSGFTAGKAIFSLVPFGTQAFAGTFSLLQTVANAQPVAVNLAVAGASQAIEFKDITNAVLIPNTAATNEVVLNVGTYQYTATASGAPTCVNQIATNGGAVVISENSITDLFVLNNYGCSNSASTIEYTQNVAVVQTRGPASATGNSPFSTTTTRREARHIVA